MVADPKPAILATAAATKAVTKNNKVVSILNFYSVVRPKYIILSSHLHYSHINSHIILQGMRFITNIIIQDPLNFQSLTGKLYMIAFRLISRDGR